ncbi:hypothetical protein [Streptomyces sp. Ru87]|uniref:hypothetical protein n=1 Tax=Streptomyces sp. Ru87 TaxID=2044307 RepID=UPI0015D5230F|nr:hypothetical protein [Streptomyces sp. Ru87]
MGTRVSVDARHPVGAPHGPARAELPKGLRLIPVKTLDGAVAALKALEHGGEVPAC